MNRVKTVLLSSLAVLSMGLVTASVTLNNKNNEEIIVYAESVQSYYSSITDSMSGTTLLNALNALNNTKRKKQVGYANMRTFSKKSDADPNGSGKILSFYDNKLVGPSWDSGQTWNREHVWPNVRGGNRVENDAHMTRPSATSTNSDRGSKGYGVESYDPGKYVEYYRGSASRIIFYAAIADLNLHLIDDPLNYNGAGSHPDSMGSLSEMLAWNLQYQPSNTSFTGNNDIARRAEINRNNVIQSDSEGQGNRNPFIDHPEYACRIWGNYNAKTQQICSGHIDPPPTLESIELDIHEKNIDVGGSFTLHVSANPSDASLPSVTWSSSNPSVATVNNGFVKGIAAGSCEITVKSLDNTFSDKCVVNVGGTEIESIQLDIHEKHIEIGEEFTLTALIEPSNLSGRVELDWYSKDSKVASVNNNGLVTGLSNGKTTIVVVTADFSFMDECVVTVGTGKSSTPAKSNGCGGNIATTSVLLSTISLLGIALFLIRHNLEKKNNENA